MQFDPNPTEHLRPRIHKDANSFLSADGIENLQACPQFTKQDGFGIWNLQGLGFFWFYCRV